MAFIRPYKRKDFEAAANICRKTLPASFAASEPLHRIAPYIWTHQFTHLSPSTCFVLDDGTGHAVGYCIGCPDIDAFYNSYPSYISDILTPSSEINPPSNDIDPSKKAAWLVDGEFDEQALAQTAYSAHWLLIDGREDLLKDGYKAMMHIDLLDEWQGKGWGKKLIETFVESVRDVKMSDGGESKGIFIGIGETNKKVVQFYEKQKFRVKERGVKTKDIWMDGEHVDSVRVLDMVGSFEAEIGELQNPG